MNYKLIFNVLYVLLNVVIVFGFVEPYLISADSYELVIAGIILIIANGLHLYAVILNNILKPLLNEED